MDAPPSEVKELGCSMKRILVPRLSFLLVLITTTLTNVLRSLLLHAGAERNGWLASSSEILAFFFEGEITMKGKYETGAGK